MAFDTRAYRILVASPSDVVDERDAAVRVMHDWNNLHSHNRRVVLLPLRWETHSAPEYNVRPQEAINRRIVDDCDLVVGIFWTRLGSPTGEADSGTLEEIERAAKAGKPVMLYFSQVPVAPDRVDVAQIARLRSFRDAVLTNALVDTFRSALEFRDKFAGALELKIRDLQRADDAGQPSPLDLQFCSIEDGRLLGSQLRVGLSVPGHCDSPPTADAELERHFQSALSSARAKAGTVPLLLAVRNLGTVGIRNLFIEIVFHPTSSGCDVSTSPPFARRQAAWSMSFLSRLSHSEGDSTEYEEKLARIMGKGLSQEGGKWKLRLEWEALQPQRIRLVEPMTFLRFRESGVVEITAQVYADSFAAPLPLRAQLAAEVDVHVPDSEGLLERAKALLASEKVDYVFVDDDTRPWVTTFKQRAISSSAAEPADAADRPSAGS